MRRVPKKQFFCTTDVYFNIVIGHLGRPYSTHTAPMPVLTGSVHAHILTKPSRAGFAVIRLELMEPSAETCVYQAKACSPTDQPDSVRKFKDENLLHFNVSHHARSIARSGVSPACAAATVTTHAKPHAQQQLARDSEVERAAMGQRCRPQSFGELRRCNPLHFL